MNKLLSILSLGALLAGGTSANATIKVLATTADWGALTQELGGDKVNVYTATTAMQDVHRVEAKPSLVARARTADLLVATGAELEIGWLPVLAQESGNSKIQPGGSGYFEVVSALHLLEIPSRVDRSMGDIHPLGNPHVQLDPHNVLAVAHALSAKLAQLEPAQAAFYQQRGKDFETRWTAAIARWETKAAPLKGRNVVVHHNSWIYLTTWLGLHEIGSLEPKPGVPPTSAHLATLVDTTKAQHTLAIIRAAYQDPKPADWLAERAGVPAVTLPFTVGGDAQSKDLFSFYDSTIDKLLGAAK
jgi:zinc/manganese transport system substrate-binding protein